MAGARRLEPFFDDESDYSAFAVRAAHLCSHSDVQCVPLVHNIYLQYTRLLACALMLMLVLMLVRELMGQSRGSTRSPPRREAWSGRNVEHAETGRVRDWLEGVMAIAMVMVMTMTVMAIERYDLVE